MPKIVKIGYIGARRTAAMLRGYGRTLRKSSASRVGNGEANDGYSGCAERGSPCFGLDDGSVGTRIWAEWNKSVAVPIPDGVVHRRIRVGVGRRAGQARSLLRRGTGDLPDPVRADQHA